MRGEKIGNKEEGDEEALRLLRREQGGRGNDFIFVSTMKMQHCDQRHTRTSGTEKKGRRNERKRDRAEIIQTGRRYQLVQIQLDGGKRRKT